MSQAQDHAGLVADFAALAKGGSSDPVLNACATLIGLGPVVLAIQGGVHTPLAARTLLEITVRRANNGQDYVRAAAALTGIDPPDTGRGVRDDEGPGARQKAAGVELGGRQSRTVRQPYHRQRCYVEYASAVLDFVRDISRDRSLMATFLIQCGVSNDDAIRLTAPLAPTSRTAANQPSGLDHPSPADAPDSGNGAQAQLARLIPLAGVVRQALDAARASCMAKNRAFYTPDLLLALLDLPNSRTAECFNGVQGGLAQYVRERLSRNISKTNADQVRPFQPFEWTERPDVRLGQDLALADGSPAVTEVYLLLGVLGSESSTRRWLTSFPERCYDRLCEMATASRQRSTPFFKTPGLDHSFDHADWPKPTPPITREGQAP